MSKRRDRDTSYQRYKGEGNVDDIIENIRMNKLMQQSYLETMDEAGFTLCEEVRDEG